jgi:hypothetical protein
MLDSDLSKNSSFSATSRPFLPGLAPPLPRCRRRHNSVIIQADFDRDPRVIHAARYSGRPVVQVVGFFVWHLSQSRQFRRYGLVPESTLADSALPGDLAALTSGLIVAGLWHPAEGGYAITDWALTYQTRAERKALRRQSTANRRARRAIRLEKEATRKRRARAATKAKKTVAASAKIPPTKVCGRSERQTATSTNEIGPISTISAGESLSPLPPLGDLAQNVDLASPIAVPHTSELDRAARGRSFRPEQSKPPRAEARRASPLARDAEKAQRRQSWRLAWRLARRLEPDFLFSELPDALFDAARCHGPDGSPPIPLDYPAAKALAADVIGHFEREREKTLARQAPRRSRWH